MCACLIQRMTRSRAGWPRVTTPLVTRLVAAVVAVVAVVAMVAMVVLLRWLKRRWWTPRSQRRECLMGGTEGAEVPVPPPEPSLSPAPSTPSAMVIVEPRQHKHLKYVVENFDANMPPHYDLYVFHGASGGAFARRCVAGITRRRVVLVPLHTDNLTADQYNELFKQAEFWNAVQAENILVFQTDAVLCPRSPWSIADFERYGYVGCAYDGTAGPGTHWGPAHAFWGVGGLSFRKKSLMMRCIRDMHHGPHDPEDVFYSDCVQRYGDGDGSVPSDYVAPDARALSRFCSQNTHLMPSFGAHRVHDMMDKNQLPGFVEFCPAMAPILDTP